MKIPQTNPHPLKNQLAKTGLRRWQIRELIPGKPCETKLWRMLTGIQPMGKDVETAIKTILASVEASHEGHDS